MLRRHPQPDPRRFEKLSAVCASFGCELKTGTNLELATSLNAACAVLAEKSAAGDAVAAAGGELLGTVLRIMTTRCMSQAVYFCAGQQAREEYRHYGLAVPIYTHFTSPIRRYADVIVHRMLAAAIGAEPLVAGYDDKSAQATLCDNINRRTLMAQLAGRASTELYTRIYLKNAPGAIVETAVVMATRARGAVVFVPRLGIEAFVRLAPEEWSFEEADEEAGRHLSTLTAVAGGGGRLSALAQVKVSIALTQTDAMREELVLTLVE
jgi:exosome complex exonuclease DIS3/RRP44